MASDIEELGYNIAYWWNPWGSQQNHPHRLRYNVGHLLLQKYVISILYVATECGTHYPSRRGGLGQLSLR